MKTMWQVLTAAALTAAVALSVSGLAAAEKPVTIV
jgi:hypothetical protein